MSIIHRNILITGPPRVGKTTLIKQLFETLADLNPIGFYTEEIREGGIRSGFRLVGSDGKEGVLSHVDIRSRFRVGKYHVDVKGFEGFLDRLGLEQTAYGLVIIDEIGKMECFSKKFIATTYRLLDSDQTVIATIAQRASGVIDTIKNRDDVQLHVLTPTNRDDILQRLLIRIRHLDLDD